MDGCGSFHKLDAKIMILKLLKLLSNMHSAESGDIEKNHEYV